MPKRKAKEKYDIDVVPYLSIMVIVLKLICLILIVTVMRIALNPKALGVMSFVGLYAGVGNIKDPKVPSYVDCFPDGISTYPGKVNLTASEIARPGNALEGFLDRVRANSSNEYVIILVRPQSLAVFRKVRKMVAERGIEMGYDAMDADFKVNWSEEAKALGFQIPEE